MMKKKAFILLAIAVFAVWPANIISANEDVEIAVEDENPTVVSDGELEEISESSVVATDDSAEVILGEDESLESGALLIDMGEAGSEENTENSDNIEGSENTETTETTETTDDAGGESQTEALDSGSNLNTENSESDVLSEASDILIESIEDVDESMIATISEETGDWTWDLSEDGTLTVSGSGEMTENSYVPWYSQRSSIKSVVIESGITTICSYAFWNCENLTSISLPDTLTDIGICAFSTCKSLPSVTIPDSVITIGSNAFAYCTGLKNVVLGDGVQALGEYSFANCTNLVTLRLPASLTTVSAYAFNSCSNLAEVYYGGSEAAWANISIGSSNTYLTGADIYYNSSKNILPRVNLSVLDMLSGGIKINWEPVSDAEGYYVYRKTSSDSYSVIATINDASATSFTDTNVASGTEYSYEVRAFAGGASGTGSSKKIIYYSNTVSDVAELSIQNSTNIDAQTYSTRSSVVNSYLTAVSGGFMRVEYTSDAIIVEYYDSAMNLTRKKTVLCELESFGGFYAASNAYYLVFGQSNSGEDDSIEVIRVVKYSTDWVRQGEASLYGANTTVPFSSGSLRMTERGGYLYIRTSHKMYASSDGLNHQANVTVLVNESDMTIAEAHYKVASSPFGYVSHSFNQFVLVDDAGNFVSLDHGDAYPRAAVLNRCAAEVGGGSDYASLKIFSFQGETGDNATGASLGGLEYSSSSYLVAGNSVNQDSGWSSYTTRNIFVTVTSRNDFSTSGTSVRWITSYSMDTDITVSTPQLVKLGSDRFLLLWTEETSEEIDDETFINRTLRFVYLDGQGNATSEIYSATGMLSDCQPIVSGNTVYWYCTDSSEPVFFSIDLNQPSVLQSSVDYSTPSEFSSLTNLSSGIKLKWTEVSGAAGYYIYRKTGSDDYEIIQKITNASTVSYTDKTVKSVNGTKYTYMVKPYFGHSKIIVGNGGEGKIVRLTKVSLSSVKNKSSKTVTVKWKKKSKVTGYEIQYARNSSFTKGCKTKTISKSAKTSCKLKNLKMKKTYYVRIRSYKTVSGVKYYSAWSKAKKVRISK
ncbi:MAG: fibronectin type III domain-containing protein [Lachnospiraceae bacterium]|nr:fibronectin type III domain-containing protein [Lachnospiraceae bacterium]